MDLSPQLAFLIEFMDLQEATGDPKAAWEVFQIEYLNKQTLFTIDDKSRQIGWSWTAAADAVASGCLEPGTPSIFVSINLEEAREKVRYAKAIMAALDEEVRPRLLTDNQFELEFSNGSRLISHPCRPVRGKAKARVYLDEFAHYPWDRRIYASALPVTTRGGCVRIGSSPLGAGGMFWEIFEQKMRAYPGYERAMIPWWELNALCVDVVEARKLAPLMETEERVRMFGTERLIMIFENLPIEDFQQEYECAWVDEAVAWITWALIKRNQLAAQEQKLWYRMAHGIDEAMNAIEELGRAHREDVLFGTLAGGMDIGRRRNVSEIVLVGKDKSAHTPYRLGITLAQTEFEDQESVVIRMLDTLPISYFVIDETGIGMQLAENMTKRFKPKVRGVSFTNANKELWSVDLKVRMEKSRVPLPLDRDLSYQIHSIKKKVTAAKHSVFDTERNERHHADKYWALALAVAASMVKVQKHKKPKAVKYA